MENRIIDIRIEDGTAFRWAAPCSINLIVSQFMIPATFKNYKQILLF